MPEELLVKQPLALIGDEDMVLGFQAIGFKVYALNATADFKTILAKVREEKNAVCLIQEDFYRAYAQEINNYRHLKLPIYIPFSKEIKTEALKEIIKDIRLKATGVF